MHHVSDRMVTAVCTVVGMPRMGISVRHVSVMPCMGLSTMPLALRLAHMVRPHFSVTVVAAVGDAPTQVLDPQLTLIEVHRGASAHVIDIGVVDTRQLQQLATNSLSAQAGDQASDFNGS